MLEIFIAIWSLPISFGCCLWCHENAPHCNVNTIELDWKHCILDVNRLNELGLIHSCDHHGCRRVSSCEQHLELALLYCRELRWGVLRCRARVVSKRCRARAVGNEDKWWLALLCKGILKVKCVSDNGWCIDGIITQLQKRSDYSPSKTRVRL